MPRKTPVRELQKEEPVPSSPLRRSSRISNNSPVPTKVLTRRNSSSESTTSTPRITRGRRSSLSQEPESNNDVPPEKEKKKTTSTIKTRRGSLSSNADDEEPVKTRTRASSVAKEQQTSDVKKTTKGRKSMTEESGTNEDTKEKITRSRSSSVNKKTDSDDSKTLNEKTSAPKDLAASSTPIKKSVSSDSGNGTLESIEEINKETSSPGSATTESSKKRKTDGAKIDFDLSVINEASLTEEEISPKKVSKSEDQAAEDHFENKTKVDVPSELAEKDTNTNEVVNKSLQKVTTNKSNEISESKENVTNEKAKEAKSFDSSVSDGSFNLQLENSQNETDANDDKENIRPNEKPILQEPEIEPMDVDEPILQSPPPTKNQSPKSTKLSLAKKVTEVQQVAEKITHEIDEFLKEEVRFSAGNGLEEKSSSKIQNEVLVAISVEERNELPIENTKKSSDGPSVPKPINQAEITVDSLEAEGKQSTTEHQVTSKPVSTSVLQDKVENEVSSSQESMEPSGDAKSNGTTTDLELPKNKDSQTPLKPNSPEKSASTVLIVSSPDAISNESRSSQVTVVIVSSPDTISSESRSSQIAEPLVEDDDANKEYTLVISAECSKSSSSPEQTETQGISQVSEERLLESDKESDSTSFEIVKSTETIAAKLKTPEKEVIVPTQIEVEDCPAQQETVEEEKQENEIQPAIQADISKDIQEVVILDESIAETEKTDNCDSHVKDQDDITSNEIETKTVASTEVVTVVEQQSCDVMSNTDLDEDLEVIKINEHKNSSIDENVTQNKEEESESNEKSFEVVSDEEVNVTKENERISNSNEAIESENCIPLLEFKKEKTISESDKVENCETSEKNITEEVAEDIAQDKEVTSDAKIEENQKNEPDFPQSADLEDDKDQSAVQNDEKINEEDEQLNTTTEEKSIFAHSFRRRSVDRTSITLQETLKAGDEKEKSVSERIHKVVDLFCAGLKNKSDVSINVSLEYVGQISDAEEETTDVLEVSLTASDIKQKATCDERRSKRRKICVDSKLESPQKHHKPEAKFADEVAPEDNDNLNDDDESVNSEPQEVSKCIDLLNETLQDDSDSNDASWVPDKEVSSDSDPDDFNDDDEEPVLEKESIIKSERTERKITANDSELQNDGTISASVSDDNDKKVKLEKKGKVKTPKKLGRDENEVKVKEKSSASDSDDVFIEDESDSDARESHDDDKHDESFMSQSSENSLHLKKFLTASLPDDSDINDTTWGPDEEKDSADSDSDDTESDSVDEEPITENELVVVGKRIRRKTDSSESPHKDPKNSRENEDKNIAVSTVKMSPGVSLLEKKNKRKSPKKPEQNESEVKKNKKEKFSAGQGTGTGNGEVRKVSQLTKPEEDDDSHNSHDDEDEDDDSFISQSQEDSRYLSKLLSVSLQDSDGNDTTWKPDKETDFSNSDSDDTQESGDEEEPIVEKELLIVESKRIRRKTDNSDSPQQDKKSKRDNGEDVVTSTARMTQRVSFSEVSDKKVTPEKRIKLKSPKNSAQNESEVKGKKNKKQTFLEGAEADSHTEDVDESSPKKKVVRTPFKSKIVKMFAEDTESSEQDEDEEDKITDSPLKSHLKELLGQSLETWKPDQEESDSCDTDDTNDGDGVEIENVIEDQLVEDKKMKKKHSTLFGSESPDKELATKKDRKRKLFRLSKFNVSEAFKSSELEESIPKKQKKKTEVVEKHCADEYNKKQKSKKNNKNPGPVFNESEPMKYNMHPETSELGGKKNKKRKLPSITKSDEDTQSTDTVKPKKKTVRDLREKLDGSRQKRSDGVMKPSTKAPIGWSVTTIF